MLRRHSFVFLASLIMVSIQVLGCSSGSKKTTLGISGTLPATGVVGAAYSGTLTASGGKAPYTWGTPSGFPPGVTATPGAATLAFSGAPTAAGTFSGTVSVTDSKAATAPFSISIVVTTVSVSTTSLATGTVHAAYNTSLTAINGTSPYTWSETSGGALPAGLSLSAAGVISGVPTATGTSGPYVFQVTDANGITASSGNLSIMIVAQTNLHIVGPVFPDGTVGTPYAGPAITVTGGNQPYTFAITQNSGLIPGLTMDANTGALSGTPQNAGTFPISFNVTDSSVPAQVAPGNFSITINASVTSVCVPRENEAALTTATPYAFMLRGNDDDDGGIVMAGSFTPNGDGTISAAEMDINGLDIQDEEQLVVDLTASSYAFGTDGRGCLFLAFSNIATAGKKTAKNSGQQFHAFNGAHARVRKVRVAKKFKTRGEGAPVISNITFSFALGTFDGEVFHTGRIQEFDNTADGGTVAAGSMNVQDSSSFDLTTFKTNYAFGMAGWDPGDNRIALAGNFTNTAGSLSLGLADVNDGGVASGRKPGGIGNINATIDASGRGSGTYTIPNGDDAIISFDFAIYVINASDFYIMATDPSDSVPAIGGRVLETAASFTATPLNGFYLLTGSGFDPDAGANAVEIGTLQATSAGAIPTVNTYVNDAGDVTTPVNTDLTYSVDTGGRVTISGTNSPVAYLTSGGDVGENIQGFLVGTDANAGSGILVLQGTGTPAFTVADVAGQFAFGSEEDVDGLNASLAGTFTMTGTGAAGTYANILDIASEGADTVAGQAGSGTIAVNADGSGNFDSGNELSVTNGSQIFAIDGGDVDPLLYTFNAGDAPAAARKTKKK
jgi:hypothetical protein